MQAGKTPTAANDISLAIMLSSSSPPPPQAFQPAAQQAPDKINIVKAVAALPEKAASANTDGSATIKSMNNDDMSTKSLKKANMDAKTREIDTLLRAKWTAFSDALKIKDIDTALTMMDPTSRKRYEIMFNSIKDQLPAIMATHTDLELIKITEDEAYYEHYTMENGEAFAYSLSFRKNSNGQWLIMEF
jgi:hypothetical protein